MQDIRPISEYGPACAGPIPYVITIIREPGRKAIPHEASFPFVPDRTRRARRGRAVRVQRRFQ
ncbi:hypothetical protein RE9431_30130 [Prescottella equi]|nr:hypothetical protein RE9414_30390 [Prescottella equi]BCN49708.1 hypothetical protein RE9416_30090 [Prescottella equi]BCN54690.1 hypothetical protein RE9425_30800 [Prescottella equi]BCN59652.1 hypothetical protein RE9427_30220 [Prescottella equi]BCN64558.1 hypothetical protein RE9431_30130 [Prescottella equi]